VLPAASQYEKAEATFFAGEMPANWFHVRAPVLEPLGESLPEPEIHARLVRAMGGLPAEVDGLAEAAEQGHAAFAEALARASAANPDVGAKLPVVLHQTLGRTLPDGMQSAAILYGAAMQASMRFPDQIRAAGIDGDGPGLAANLFDAILEAPSGRVVTVSGYEDTWDRLAHDDGRVHLAVPELLDELDGLVREDPTKAPADFPFVLSAGERRSSNANTVIRMPRWSKKDQEGALRIHPADATAVGLVEGDRARIESKRGAVEAMVAVTDAVLPGHVTLPHGFGLEYPDEVGELGRHGPAVNELTSLDDRDWLALTPHHKHVRVRISGAV
jgi:formate dehydrogenase